MPHSEPYRRLGRNPRSLRAPTHRPEDWVEDNGDDDQYRLGDLYFGTTPEDFEHNHAGGGQMVCVGMSETAPGHHLFVCSSTVDCPATLILKCRGEECSLC